LFLGFSDEKQTKFRTMINHSSEYSSNGVYFAFFIKIDTKVPIPCENAVYRSTEAFLNIYTKNLKVLKK
jgi:hypothetical protein